MAEEEQKENPKEQSAGMDELTKASARISELEQAMAGKDSDIASLKQSKDELEGKLKTVNGSLLEAVATYRKTVAQANPDVLEELITGDSIQQINESLSKAKALVNKVKRGVEAEISLSRVPAGAPERKSPDISALSPREKIQKALAK